jgi:hypothetical protein
MAPVKKTTLRGFICCEFSGTYNTKGSLQQASMGNIWLGVKDARIHLSRAQVAELLPLLQHFVITGELGE